MSGRSLSFGILGIGVVLLGAVQWKYRADRNTALTHYRTESHEQSAEVAHRLENTFQQMYQGLRTMARLPGVQNIDRYARHFDANARSAVQEIYNNLGSNVAMSEVYIVPLDLEPDKRDPITKKPQIPIITFDHLIINRLKDKKEEDTSGVEEVEIYEYRLMKEQLAWMRQTTPNEKSVQGLAYPAVAGPEVITCDNSHYSPAHPDDKDRSGLVYSVPFFDPKGRLKGCLSGVILTHAFRDLLPSGSYVLCNKKHDYCAVPHVAGTWQTSEAWVKQGQPDPGLLFSETVPVSATDASGEWIVWAGLPDATYFARSDVRGARQFALFGSLGVFALTGGLWWIALLVRRSQKAMQANHQVLMTYHQKMSSIAEAVAGGNLTLTVTPESEDDMLGFAFNKMIFNLRVLVGALSKSVDTTTATSQELVVACAQNGEAAAHIDRAIQGVARSASQSAQTSHEIAQGSEQQAQAATAAADAMEQLQQTIAQVQQGNQQQREAARQVAVEMEQAADCVRTMTHSAQAMQTAAQQAVEVARSGGQTVEKTVRSISTIHTQVQSSAIKVLELGKKGQEIGAIVETIAQIAEQTNLLALNAAIEAARAGEQGRGFAVVADEVRKLAERSAAAAREIESLISGVQSQVKEAVNAMESSRTEVSTGTALAEESGQALTQIQAASGSVLSEMESVLRVAHEMETSVRCVLASMQEVVQRSEENEHTTVVMTTVSAQVAESITTVASVSQQTAAGAEEMSAAAAEVSLSAQTVVQIVAEQSRQIEGISVSANRLSDLNQELVMRFNNFEWDRRKSEAQDHNDERRKYSVEETANKVWRNQMGPHSQNSKVSKGKAA